MKSLFKNKILYIYLFSVVLLVLAFSFGIMLGPVDISIFDFLDFGLNSHESKIIYYLRIPRALATILCGGALASAGAVIQGVLGNKLASPSIIGVNSGAALTVTVCSAMGIVGGWRISLFAFIGAFITVMLVSLCSKKFGMSKSTVILTGVALNSFLGAVSDSITTFVPEVSIMSNDFKIGDFSSVTYTKLLPASVLIIISIILLITLSNELDVLTLGDDNARGLGLNTEVMRVIFLALAAVLSASAVSICGLLSFVGLLVPHAIRKIAGTESRHLLPLSALVGGGFVSACDTLSRMLFAPYEIPVGIIMAFLGAPFFIFILVRRDKNA